MAVGLCDNCALKYADCKGNKDLEKLKCDYYKKPIVMNVKDLAERVAELEIKLKDSVEVVRCKDCKYKYVSGNGITQYYICDFMDAQYEDDGYCSHGERKEDGDTE